MSSLSFEISPPDLTPWLAGNTGTAGVWRFAGEAPGRHVLVTALVHGNEICGAWALRDWLEAGVRPRRGTLTLAFANLDAFSRFDPAQPHASRFAHTDMNRLWGDMPWRHDGAETGSEHQRVLELLPYVNASDWLLDLHSMHEPGPPLGMVGPLDHHARTAEGLELEALLIADHGHRAGVRLRDHARYGDALAHDAFALLVECGFHGASDSINVAHDVMARFLTLSGVVDPVDVPRGWRRASPRQAAPLLEVTHAITVAPGEAPRFTQAWRCGDLVEKAGTVIGWNAEVAVSTPYDKCVLVMPTLTHATPGATLVRLAKRREVA